MRKFSFLLAALCAFYTLSAQTPANDDCNGIVDLGIAPACPGAVFSNINATASDIGTDNLPSCFLGDTATHDVWFQFTTPTGLLDFRVTIAGSGANAISNPQVAVYRGDCQVDGLAELLCAPATVGENEVFLDLTGLTPGLPYFIRVSDFSPVSTPNWGEFTVCVDSIPPVVTIDGGSSDLCEGTIYDTGGPDGDYGPNEDHVFVICPSDPAACIEFTLDYFNIQAEEFDLTDQLILYDGPDVFSPVLAAIGGDPFTGQGAVAGGGSVCFQAQATSGCLTLQFISDDAVELEGFAGKWKCSAAACPQPDQPLVNNFSVNADSIAAVISTPATTVNVTKIDCLTGAYGTFRFAGDPGPIGLQEGLLLTSGNAQLAIGPNDDFLASQGNNTPGDPDLDTLSAQSGNPIASFDACIIELDVFANTDQLTFEYVFGSEEYPEFVGTNFNDIFAFLISGPGIAGDPALGGARNIAVLPGTNIPIEIESVNNLLNWPYYRNTENSLFIRYDGMTIDSMGKKKSLTARTNVIPCNTYRIKLAVADRLDTIYDSGVFISRISGGGPNLEVAFAGGVDYQMENCTGNQDEVVVKLTEPEAQDATFTVQVGGTATRNLDYELMMPDMLTIPAGVTQLNFPIKPLQDTLTEGTETIVINLLKDFGCGPVVVSSVSLDLRDNAQVEINAAADTIFACAGAVVQLAAEGALDYSWQPPAAVSNPNIANPVITAGQDIWLSVTGAIAACSDVDSIFIRVLDPAVDVLALGDTVLCSGDSVQLQATTNTNGFGLKWTPSFGLDNPLSETPFAFPGSTTTYRATVEIAGCSTFDEVTILVDTLFFPNLIGDTTICQNFPVKLADDLLSTTLYDWSPGTSLSDSTVSGPVATPNVTTTYTLIATSANGSCADTAQVTVTVIPADIALQAPDSLRICLGEMVPLVANVNPPGGATVWSPAFYVTPDTGTSVIATTLDESVTIFATYTVNNCVVRDSVYIRVDSLPDQTISLSPDKPFYCPGDTVLLLSPTYEPSFFPDIQHAWLPAGQQETPADRWNMVITATDTLIFQRITQNGACIDTASVQVNVPKPPNITATASPAGVCPGGSTQLNAVVDPDQTLEWMPDPSLSCTDCANPVATPLNTTQYTVMAPEALCPAAATIQVEVFPLPLLGLTPSPAAICQGSPIQLNSVVEPDVTYAWTSNPPGFVSGAPTPVVSPAVTTTYFVSAINAQQCQSVGEVTVIVNSGAIDAGADQTICFGSTATLVAVTTGTPGSVVWQPGNLNGNTVDVSPGLTTDYTATYTFGNDCQASDVVRVNVLPPVQLSAIQAEPDTTPLCEGIELRLTVGVIPATATLVWSQNDEPIPGQSDTTIVVTPTGDQPDPVNYVFTVVAVDSNGCTATTNAYSIDILRCLFVPNVFSPGNDNINETFGIVEYGGATVVESIEIYNRWGQKVFSGGRENSRWDGKADGKPAPMDVYVYVINVRFPDGSSQRLHGDVTLLR